MEQVVVGLLGMVGVLLVAMVEWSRRANQRDHALVLKMIQQMGDGLGHSIDRVEKSARHTEEELDTHIADHARGAFTTS